MIIAGLRQCSLSHGPGKRFVILLPGCHMNCSGCAAALAPDAGTRFSLQELTDQMELQPDLEGLTITGGDPFRQAEECAALARAAREMGLNVRCGTIRRFEDILAQGDAAHLALLAETDILEEPGRLVRARESLSAGETLLAE